MSPRRHVLPEPEQGPRDAAAACDEARIALIQQGDSAAFEQIFRAHYAALCGSVYKLLGSRADAEEIVQEVLRRVWERRAQWAPQGSIENYLHRAVRNEAVNRLRRRKLEYAWYEQAAAAPEHEPQLCAMRSVRRIDKVLEDEELLAAVRRAVETLPERCRLIFELKWEHELRYAEIADALGISIKTVENQLLKALKALRLALGQSLEL
jgi:RNA polymerase sigma-70 factor (ECF subfamily)